MLYLSDDSNFFCCTSLTEVMFILYLSDGGIGNPFLVQEISGVGEPLRRGADQRGVRWAVCVMSGGGLLGYCGAWISELLWGRG